MGFLTLSNSKKTIYVNSGYYNTKYSCDGVYKIMESKAQINDCANRYLVIEDEKLEVGVGKRDINTKDNNLLNHYLTIYSILDFCNAEDEVNILLALPYHQYINVELREKYKNSLSSKALEYNINGVKKKVLVDRCEVYLEGASAMLNAKQQEEYKDKFDDNIIGLIDIGGNTILCMIFDNGKLIKKTIVQINSSMLVLETNIINNINSKLSTYYQDYEFKRLLKSDDTIIKDIIENRVSVFIDNLIYELRVNQWNDIRNIPLFFTGGGSIILKPYLEIEFPNAIFSDDALFDNVKGLEIVGKVAFK